MASHFLSAKKCANTLKNIATPSILTMILWAKQYNYLHFKKENESTKLHILPKVTQLVNIRARIQIGRLTSEPILLTTVLQAK